jgi:hypothetical protein
MYLRNDFDEVIQALVTWVLGIIPVEVFQKVFDAYYLD